MKTTKVLSSNLLSRLVAWLWLTRTILLATSICLVLLACQISGIAQSPNSSPKAEPSTTTQSTVTAVPTWQFFAYKSTINQALVVMKNTGETIAMFPKADWKVSGNINSQEYKYPVKAGYWIIDATGSSYAYAGVNGFIPPGFQVLIDVNLDEVPPIATNRKLEITASADNRQSWTVALDGVTPDPSRFVFPGETKNIHRVGDRVEFGRDMAFTLTKVEHVTAADKKTPASSYSWTLENLGGYVFGLKLGGEGSKLDPAWGRPVWALNASVFYEDGTIGSALTGGGDPIDVVPGIPRKSESAFAKVGPPSNYNSRNISKFLVEMFMENLVYYAVYDISPYRGQ